MDIAALFLAAAAAFVFLVDSIDRRRATPPTWAYLQSVGLFLLTVALICQFTQVSHHPIH